MKQLGPLMTVSILSLFTTGLLLLSGSTPFSESFDPNHIYYLNKISSKAGTKTLPAPNTSPTIETKIQKQSSSSSNVDASLSKNYLEPLLEAELALSRGDLKIALTNYIRVAKETQDPSISKRATEVALLYGAIPQAQEAAGLWVKSDPSNLEAKLTMAAILIRIGDIKQAAVFFKQIDQLDPAQACDQWLALYKQLEDPLDRAHIVETLEHIQSKNAYLALSQIYLFQSDAQKALTNSHKALESDPTDTQAIIVYTQSLLSTNQIEKAQQFFDAQLQKQPKNIELKLFYIQFYYEQNQPQKAYNQLVLLTKMEGLSAAELFGLARLSMEGHWFAQAKILLEKLEKLPDQSDLARYFLGRLSDLQSNPLEAIEFYQKVQNPPFYIMANIRASLLYNSLKNSTQALTILNNLEANTAEEDRQIAIAKVEVLASIKKYKEALILVNGLMQDTPNDIELIFTRAMLSEKISDIQTAEKDLKSILAIDSNHVNALNGLGFILADKTTRHKEANEILSKALALSPNNPSILDSMGWLEFKMGNSEKAVILLQQALTLLPDPEIAAHLGEVLWAMNKQEQAKQIWEKALKAHPEHEALLKAMRQTLKNN